MVVLKKIKSNTLVEVLVSTVIISVLMSIAVMIILNLSRDVYLSSVNKDVNKLNEEFYLELHKTNGLHKIDDPELSLKMFKDFFQLSTETQKEEEIIRNGDKE